jgi:repressor LexA
MATKPLTKRQQEILDFIHEFISEQGYPPTLRQIGERLGVSSPNGARDHLIALQRKGFIRLHPQTSRGIEVLRGPSRGIPLVGRIAAGQPILAVENVEDHLTLERIFPSDGRIFALRVKGESMNGDAIRDGDIVIVRPQPVAEPGDIVVALIGDEATVKRFSQRGNCVRLEPSNPAFKPIEADSRDVEIAGLVIGVVRKLRL